MNPAVVGVAIGVTVGAVLAVSARDARAALVGLAITLVAAPFLVDPLPQVTTLATRIVGAALGAYLLRTAVSSAAISAGSRGRNGPTASRLGWPAEALLAGAAWVVGLNVAAALAGLSPAAPATTGAEPWSLLTPGGVAAAAGLAAIVVGVVPALAGRDALRTALGSLVLVQGVLLVGVGLAGAPGDLEQLADATLLVSIAIAGAWLVAAEGRRPAGGDDTGRGHGALRSAGGGDSPEHAEVADEPRDDGGGPVEEPVR